MKKKLISLLLVLVFTLSFTACGVEIEDTNGPDDYSLATITADNIANQDLGASSYSQSPSSEEVENLAETTRLKSDNFSGVAQIYLDNLLGKSDLTIDVSNLTVNSGNFSLVVLLDGEIVHEFTKDELMETYELKDVNGTVEVVMAGESADFKFWIQVW